MTKPINSFPGYECIWDSKAKEWKNMYRGTDVGMGGYVYSEPNMYGNVALLDVQSMHPNSAINLNAFGEYTKNYKDILDARVAIKHKDFDTARTMLDGKLAPYLDDPSTAKDLAQALKIAINAVFGQSAAKYSNPFRDPRNKNNIIACRGALTMRTLQDEVAARGFTVAHIKTDSIKVPDATPEIIKFIMDFGENYGYKFEHEATYERMCLVNGSTYIAKYATEEQCMKLYGYVPGDNKDHPGKWTATAAQFQHPYVFKTLFTKEPISFDDLCETFEVSKGGALYLDMNENLPDVSEYEKELSKIEDKYKKGLISDIIFEDSCADLNKKIEEGHEYIFVGKVGQFCPIKPGKGGGTLYREKDGKFNAATGTTGYRWVESEMIRNTDNEDLIDMTYFKSFVDAAIYGTGEGSKHKPGISDFCDFEWFVSDDPYTPDPANLAKHNMNPLPDFMNVPIDADEEVPFDEDATA